MSFETMHELQHDLLFRLMAERSNDMIHLNDLSGKIIYANPQTYKLLGYKSEEMLNQPAGRFIDPEFHESISKDMEKVVSGEDVDPCEIRLVCKNGEMLDVEVKGFSIKIDGEIRYIGAIIRDITNRKTRIELAKIKEEWEETFDTISDFVSVHDSEFRVIKANRALCEFLAKEPEEILGHFCFELFHGLDRPIGNCPHEKAIDAGHAVTVEINDSNIGVPLQITCSPFFGKEGEFKGSVHVARSITNAGAGFGTKTSGRAGDGLVPICAWCKDIRQGDGNYIKIEKYIEESTPLRFTHCICRECQKKLYPDVFKS